MSAIENKVLENNIRFIITYILENASERDSVARTANWTEFSKPWKILKNAYSILMIIILSKNFTEWLFFALWKIAIRDASWSTDTRLRKYEVANNW